MMSFVMDQEKVIVIGFGWVGQANALTLSLMGYPVSYFDPGNPQHHYAEYENQYTKLKRLDTPLEEDDPSAVYIVCVGDSVADDGTQNLSAITAAMDSLKEAKGRVILRSTIIPSSLSQFSFDFYLPEFLHEKCAIEDCLNPYLVVIGARTKKKEPSFFKKWEYKSRKVFRGSPEEASYIKYLSNVWNATRIAFVNEIGDTIGEPYTKDDLEKIENVINFLFDGRSYLRYGKSFKGHCLPKDTRAFARFQKNRGVSSAFLDGVYAANSNHEKKEQNYKILPEWYSAWPGIHMGGRLAVRELLFSLKKNLGLHK